MFGIIFTRNNIMLQKHYNQCLRVIFLFQLHSLRVALDETRANRDRLQRESELVVQNINNWVKEQK